MHTFKQTLYNFSKFSENVINDLHSLCFQKQPSEVSNFSLFGLVRGVLSVGFCPWGFVRGILSVGFCPGFFFRGGFVRGVLSKGFCPRIVSDCYCHSVISVTLTLGKLDAMGYRGSLTFEC